ncbi:hypothetical protein BC628DRAFT_1342585 [Trametes gibbosa]|nr:hypothetical protein BC628DRAFT_1342585 [Trametes gibbosa]
MHKIVIEVYTPLIRDKWNDEIVRIGQEVCTTKIQLSYSYVGHDNAAPGECALTSVVPLSKLSQPARVLSNANVFYFKINAEDMAVINTLDHGKDGAVTRNPVDAPGSRQ